MKPTKWQILVETQGLELHLQPSSLHKGWRALASNQWKLRSLCILIIGQPKDAFVWLKQLWSATDYLEAGIGGRAGSEEVVKDVPVSWESGFPGNLASIAFRGTVLPRHGGALVCHAGGCWVPVWYKRCTKTSFVGLRKGGVTVYSSSLSPEKCLGGMSPVMGRRDQLLSEEVVHGSVWSRAKGEWSRSFYRPCLSHP